MHRGEPRSRRRGRRAVTGDAVIGVLAAQGRQSLDVEPRRVRDAPGDGGHAGNPPAPPRGLPGHPAAHLAEPFDGDRPARPGRRRARTQGGFRRRHDPVPGQHVLERHAVNDRANRRRRGAALTQRREILLEGASARPVKNRPSSASGRTSAQ